jgi:transcriptional regulator with XRE-family HTH domain
VANEREVISVAKDQPDNYLGKAIKAARQSKGFTQSCLAGLLKITPRYLKYIENGGRKPSLKLLERIIQELDIPSEEVFHTNHECTGSKLYILWGGKRPG